MAGKGGNINPTGKGGFADNPQNIAKGKWDKTTSISYNYNLFLRMQKSEFIAWKANNENATMSQIAAWEAVNQLDTELNYLKEVTDRTEGKPQVYSDITTGGEPLQIIWKETKPDGLND